MSSSPMRPTGILYSDKIVPALRPDGEPLLAQFKKA